MAHEREYSCVCAMSWVCMVAYTEYMITMPLVRPSRSSFSKSHSQQHANMNPYVHRVLSGKERRGLVLKIWPPRPGPEWVWADETMALCLISVCSKTTWNYWRRCWKNVLCILPHDFGEHNVLSVMRIWTAANESGVSCGMKTRPWEMDLEDGKPRWSQRQFYDMPRPAIIQKQSLHSIRISALWLEPLGWKRDGLQDYAERPFSRPTGGTTCSPRIRINCPVIFRCVFYVMLNLR